MLNETSLSGGLNLSAKYENSLDTSLSRQFHRETQTNPIVELTIQIFLTRTSISRYSIVFSLHRLSCSVLVDSLEEGFHVLYLHLDSHHVDPSKYTQHQLPNYCNSFLKSWYMLQLQKMCPLFRHWENNKKHHACVCHIRRIFSTTLGY